MWWRKLTVASALLGLVLQTARADEVLASGGRLEEDASPGVRAITIEEAPMEMALVAARAHIAQRLVDLGRTREAAIADAEALTLEDLRVLTEHPRMVQPAGELDNVTLAFITGVLIIGAIIAIGLASDGASISFS